MLKRNLNLRPMIFVVLALATALLSPHAAMPTEEFPVFDLDMMSIDSVAAGIDPSEMQAHIEYLSETIGVRVAGTENEREAENYICSQLESWGYIAVVSQDIELHNGRITRNVTAELPGGNPEIMVIGAHYDSKSPSPGANDNASGVAVVLELARILADTVPPYTVLFTFFGSEEIIDGNSDHHHYGSRLMASDVNLRGNIFCMTSVDMVGVGTELWIDNMGIGDDFWRGHLYDVGSELGLPVHTGERRAWSDHEAFEHEGVPVAWVHWRYDNNYHSTSDTSDRIDPELLSKTAELMLRGILGIDGVRAVNVCNTPVPPVF